MGKHLTFEQRKELERMCSDHVRVGDIAESLGVSVSTIYHELHRGRVDGVYCAEFSQRRYQENLAQKGAEPVICANETLRLWLRDGLWEGKTPAELEAELRKLDDPALGKVSHQTIYAAILQGYIPDVCPDDSRNCTATIQSDGSLYLPQWFLRENRLKRGQQFEIRKEEDTIILKLLKES